MPTALGLRIDVDTYVGAVRGLPNLLNRLRTEGCTASIFMPGGPDRTGRAVRRILTQPGYLAKLIRTGAFRTYGPSALTTALLYRNRSIVQAAEPLLKAQLDGHEFVAHGFTHTVWHNELHSMDALTVDAHVRKSVEALTEATGTRPVGFGGPGWQGNFASLHAVDRQELVLGSDTRGSRPFHPVMHGYRFKTPQVPTTLPSLDEFGQGLPPTREDIHSLFDQILEQRYPVYAAHAELEGRFHLPFWDELLAFCWREKIRVVPITEILESARANGLPSCEVIQAPVANRPGVVATQGAVVQPTGNSTSPSSKRVPATR